VLNKVNLAQQKQTAQEQNGKIKLVPCGTVGQLLLSGVQAFVTLTLTLDRVTWHTIMHQSLTSMYNTYQMSLKPETLFLWKDYLQGPLQVQSHMTQKLAKIWPDKNLDIVL